MYILVSGATTTVRAMLPMNPNLGVLLTPNDGNAAPPAGVVWAADNSAFKDFQVPKFLRFLARIAERRDCLFVCAPDVVANHAETLKRWQVWNGVIRACGLRAAFVAQDGCAPSDVPWDKAGAVFIGGGEDNRYKLGPEAAAIIAEANRRGLWTHMGRVNSARRIRYALALGVDSVDGSSFSMHPATHLPWALPIARSKPIWEGI